MPFLIFCDTICGFWTKRDFSQRLLAALLCDLCGLPLSYHLLFWSFVSCHAFISCIDKLVRHENNFAVKLGVILRGSEVI